MRLCADAAPAAVGTPLALPAESKAEQQPQGRGDVPGNACGGALDGLRLVRAAQLTRKSDSLIWTCLSALMIAL